MDNIESKTITPSGKRPRELGLEILRILAMFFIVCQHFLNHGKILAHDSDNLLLGLINALFAPSVNVFILISGYFSAGSRKFKLGKILSLWARVFFYSVLMLLVALAFGVEIGAWDVFRSLFPLLYKRYWFFTAFVILMLLTPFISAMLSSISKKEHLALVIGTFVCGYLSTRFAITDVIAVKSGYSVLWFCLLFIVGAYLKKYPIKVKKWAVFLVYAACTGIMMFFKYFLNDTSNFGIRLIYTSTDYTQPITLLASVCLLLLFLGINSNGSLLHRLITYIGSLTFGVYLIHEAPLFRSTLYHTIFSVESYYGSALAPLFVLLFALITFAACCIVDTGRDYLFRGATALVRRIKKRKGAAE